MPVPEDIRSVDCQSRYRNHSLKKEVANPRMKLRKSLSARADVLARIQISLPAGIVRQIGKVLILLKCRFSHNDILYFS